MSENTKPKKKISRRKFLVRGGLGTLGVLAVGTYVFRNPIRRTMLNMANGMDLSYMGDTSKPMVWFEVTNDNKVILHSPKVEMGQGTFTSLAQMAADEMDLSIDQIEVIGAATATGNIDGMSTGGSTSVAGLWQPLRELAATMKVMILGEAAKKMGVEASTLTTSEGVISGGGKTMTFVEAAQGVTDWKVPDTPPLKPMKDYKYIGKPVKRVDLDAKVFGDPIFGMDAEMEGMLHAAVVRPKKIGATFGETDIAAAEGMPGVVKIVKGDDFVGVVANSRIEALNAKNKIKVNWKVDKEWNSEEITDIIKVGNGNKQIIQKNGSALDDGEEGVEVLEFKSPIGAHAQIEPNGVVASVEGDKATIIISTQVIGITRTEVAEALGFDEDNVNVIPTFLGGGFGRRLHTPHAVQAAIMSKAVGKPVKYFFTREEEFQHDMFRPPTHHIVKGKLDDKGNLDALEHHFVSGDVGHHSALMPDAVMTVLGADIGAIRGGFVQYEGLPNFRSVYYHVDLPFATSWWRSLGLLANTFAIESFVDHMAGKAGKDPVQFRMDMLADDEPSKRLKGVLKAAADKAGYQNDARNGRAMGIALSVDGGSPCAHVAEVSIEKNKIKVHKVTCALDCGYAVNPDQVKAQCEGALIMGLSAAMFEQMHVKDGSLRPVIYGPYDMALMKHSPREVDVVLVQGRDKPGPVGEPPMGPIGAAIANAAYRLTGKRITEMPMKLA